MRAHPKEASFDIAAELLERMGRGGAAERVRGWGEHVAKKVEQGLLTEIPGTQGLHLPHISFSGGRPTLGRFTVDKQRPLAQVLGRNPEAVPLLASPIPGTLSSTLGAKAIMRKSLGLPLTGVPTSAPAIPSSTSLKAASFYAGAADAVKEAKAPGFAFKGLMQLGKNMGVGTAAKGISEGVQVAKAVKGPQGLLAGAGHAFERISNTPVGQFAGAALSPG